MKINSTNVSISPIMQQLRDELDKEGIPWTDRSEDQIYEVHNDRTYHYHMERTKVEYNFKSVGNVELLSCIYGYSGYLGKETGSTYGYPDKLEGWVERIDDPEAMTVEEIMDHIKKSWNSAKDRDETSEKMAPCPFCKDGGKPAVRCDVMRGVINRDEYIPYCAECLTDYTAGKVYFDSEEEAIKAWNGDRYKETCTITDIVERKINGVNIIIYLLSCGHSRECKIGERFDFCDRCGAKLYG